MAFLLKLTFSWDDEEEVMEFKTREEAWQKAKLLAIDEAESASEEHDSEIGIIFDHVANKIAVHYIYNDEWCYLDVIEKRG